MASEHQSEMKADVGAIVTAMTDGEQPFIYDTIKSVLSDPLIGQVVLCIEENNNWIDLILGAYIADPRLKLLRLPLSPAGSVRNKALKYIQMSWVAYCDGDDVWCEGKIFSQLSYARELKCDFVGSDHYLTDEKGYICALSPARYFPIPSSWIVKAEIMRQNPFIEVPYSVTSEDDEWWIRTSKSVTKARCPKMLVKYRVRQSSTSNNTESKKRNAKIVTLSSIPVFGTFIFLATWLMWIFTRQKTYMWYKGWGKDKSID